jgi:hypothetical protein
MKFYSILAIILLVYVHNNKSKYNLKSYLLDNSDQERLYNQIYYRKFSSSNISRCIPENCEFCCLSMNFCGSQQQCQNSSYTVNIFKGMFISVIIFLITILIHKVYTTDPTPEHIDDDKIDEKTLNLLISLFMHNRDNRRKFKQ